MQNYELICPNVRPLPTIRHWIFVWFPCVLIWVHLHAVLRVTTNQKDSLILHSHNASTFKPITARLTKLTTRPMPDTYWEPGYQQFPDVHVHDVAHHAANRPPCWSESGSCWKITILAPVHFRHLHSSMMHPDT